MIRGFQFLPHDSYLFALPNRIDLPYYGEAFTSSIVTEGMKNVKRAYRSALEAGWPPANLSLD